MQIIVLFDSILLKDLTVEKMWKVGRSTANGNYLIDS